MSIFEEVVELFERKGRDAYLGEPVSQAEHALQAAYLAESEGAPDTLVAAALLHDVGHLLVDPGEDLAERGIDGGHEQVGASWLASAFGDDVAEPPRLHVAAKRYLCAVDPSYLSGLSPASLLSLRLQGGPFGSEEVERFETNPRWRDALRLRRWDDAAKIPGLVVPGVDHYRATIDAVALVKEGR
jgi:phosphonate degradation associated HDIG domain protein